MKKRVLCMLLAFLTVVSICAPAFASEEPAEEVIEEVVQEEPTETPEAEEAPEVEETPDIEEIPEEESADEPEETNADPFDEPEETAVIASGNCGDQGDNVKWTLTEDLDLTIYGTGKMADYSEYGENSAPWKAYAEPVIGYIYDYRLNSLTVSEGVTNIGAYAFSSVGFNNDIYLPATVTRYEYGSFYASWYPSIHDRGSKYFGPYCFSGRDGGYVTLDNIETIDAGAYSAWHMYHMFFVLDEITIYTRDCKIVETGFEGEGLLYTLGHPDYTTVYGYTGSTAEAYAKKWGFTFVPLDATSGQEDGWVTENDKTYYYMNGEMQKGLITVDGKTYYFSPADGHMIKAGFVTVDGKRYYLAKDGHVMKGGWLTVDGKRYYLAADGHVMKGGWFTSGGKTYYLSAADGHVMKGGWLTSGGKTYYLSAADGHVLKGGWFTSGGKTYYLSAADGHVMKGGFLTVSGKQYYLSAVDGHVMKNGWVNIGGGKKALLDANGVVIKKV